VYSNGDLTYPAIFPDLSAHKDGEDARFFSATYVAGPNKSNRESPDLAGSPVSDGDILGGDESEDDDSSVRDMEEEIAAMQDIEEDDEDLGKSVCSPLI
jgi:hypothetical protein